MSFCFLITKLSICLKLKNVLRELTHFIDSFIRSKGWFPQFTKTAFGDWEVTIAGSPIRLDNKLHIIRLSKEAIRVRRSEGTNSSLCLFSFLSPPPSVPSSKTNSYCTLCFISKSAQALKPSSMKCVIAD